MLLDRLRRRCYAGLWNWKLATMSKAQMVAETCAYCGTALATTRDHIPPKSIFPSPRAADLITIPSGVSCYGSRHSAGFGAIASCTSALLAEVERVWLATPAGVIYGQAHRGRWDSDIHDVTVERMIRGLYLRIKAHWFRGLSPDLLKATVDCEQRSVGGGQFVYRFGRASDAPLHSIWLFEFHKRHWAGGQTSPQPEGSNNTALLEDA